MIKCKEFILQRRVDGRRDVGEKRYGNKSNWKRKEKIKKRKERDIKAKEEGVLRINSDNQIFGFFFVKSVFLFHSWKFCMFIVGWIICFSEFCIDIECVLYCQKSKFC